MRTIQVPTGKPYEVRIGQGLLSAVGDELLAALGAPCSVMIIADDQVADLYGESVQNALRETGFLPCIHRFPHGETHKNLTTWTDMLCDLAKRQFTRTDAVLALGGGVTGDMAGFAAATYLRGIRFVQVPTSLLAMVDSSVGGKTGLNLPMGKNLAGAFYQPSVVLCDPSALETLPRDGLLEGVAEAVKTAVLGDAKMFSWFAAHTHMEHIEDIIARCVAFKASLVTEDEFDRGKRQLLNLGHTLGHALEKLSNYQISHGKAVSIGMVYAARLSWWLGFCKESCLQEIESTLFGLDLPTAAPYPAAEILPIVLSDKKRTGNTINLVLPEKIGKCRLHAIPIEDLEKTLPLAMAE